MHIIIGAVNETQHQTKKHVKQMSESDRDTIVLFMHNHTLKQKMSYTEHLKGKIANGDVRITKGQIRNIFANLKDSIIEYNVTHNQPRVILRSSSSVEEIIHNRLQKVHLCVIIDLLTLTFVSAYYNIEGDTHASIDYSRYANDMVVEPDKYLK